MDNCVFEIREYLNLTDESTMFRVTKFEVPPDTETVFHDIPYRIRQDIIVLNQYDALKDIGEYDITDTRRFIWGAATASIQEVLLVIASGIGARGTEALINRISTWCLKKVQRREEPDELNEFIERAKKLVALQFHAQEPLRVLSSSFSPTEQQVVLQDANGIRFAYEQLGGSSNSTRVERLFDSE